MKIAILQDSLRGGGTERQSIRLTKILQAKGHEASLLVGSSGAALDDLAEQELGAALEFCTSSPTFALPKAIQKLGSCHAEMLLCMGRWAHYVAALAPGKKGRKLVATVRTSRPLPFLYRRSIRKADHLIANSRWALNYAKAQIAASAFPEASVVYNELTRTDLLQIRPETRQAARAQHQLSESTPILLNVARFSPGKGQRDLIEVLQDPSLRSCQLWLVGDGPEIPAAKNYAEQLGLADQVRFFEFTEDLSPLYAAADLFLSASTLDSFPNALLEAQAAGLPVVAYPTAGVPELIADGKTGSLADPPKPQTLVAAIKALLAAPDQLAQFRTAARAHAVEHFTRGAQEDRFCKIVSRL